MEKIKYENKNFLKKLSLPILGKTYFYFDDGKIRLSRRYEVVITEIIPFFEIDYFDFKLWEKEVEEYVWTYAKETDYFIKGDLKISENEISKIIFTRNKNNGWYGLGFWSGSLDIFGNLNDSLDSIY